MEKEVKRLVIECLRAYDPDIEEIMLFGSAVYAPEEAHDLDLLIYTRKKKDFCGYIDTINALNLSFNVDLVLVGEGEPLAGLRDSVAGAHELLWGSGKLVQEAERELLLDPPFDRAYGALKAAQGIMSTAEAESDPYAKEDLTRAAFDRLAHAARMAVMAYKVTKRSGWERLKHLLQPEPQFEQAFQQFFKVLHSQYAYHSLYPRGREREEFQKWLSEVERFVKEIEQVFTSQRKP